MSTARIIFPPIKFNFRVERRYTANELVPPDDDHPDAEPFIAAVQPPGEGWSVFVQNDVLTGWIRRLTADDGNGGGS
jgi:hypothetical protein